MLYKDECYVTWIVPQKKNIRNEKDYNTYIVSMQYVIICKKEYHP